MKVYIAGPIRGNKDYFQQFARAAECYRNDGHSVFNPAAANLEGRPITEIMKYLLPQLCDCDAIALLPGWNRSGGARVEYVLAKYLGKKILKFL